MKKCPIFQHLTVLLKKTNHLCKVADLLTGRDFPRILIVVEVDFIIKHFYCRLNGSLFSRPIGKGNIFTITVALVSSRMLILAQTDNVLGRFTALKSKDSSTVKV